MIVQFHRLTDLRHYLYHCGYTRLHLIAMVRVLGREQRSKVTSSVGETPVGAETEASQHAEEAEETADITTLETDAATRGMEEAETRGMEEAETETDQVLGHTWH